MDWKKLEKIVKDLREKDSDEKKERWNRALVGSLGYKKLKLLRSLCDKRIKVCECSKWWWEKELSDQLRKTRQTRKGKEGVGINQEERVRRWKREKGKNENYSKGEKERMLDKVL